MTRKQILTYLAIGAIFGFMFALMNDGSVEAQGEAAFTLLDATPSTINIVADPGDILITAEDLTAGPSVWMWRAADGNTYEISSIPIKAIAADGEEVAINLSELLIPLLVPSQPVKGLANLLDALELSLSAKEKLARARRLDAGGEPATEHPLAAGFSLVDDCGNIITGDKIHLSSQSGSIELGEKYQSIRNPGITYEFMKVEHYTPQSMHLLYPRCECDQCIPHTTVDVSEFYNPIVKTNKPVTVMYDGREIKIAMKGGKVSIEIDQSED